MGPSSASHFFRRRNRILEKTNATFVPEKFVFQRPRKISTYLRPSFPAISLEENLIRAKAFKDGQGVVVSAAETTRRRWVGFLKILWESDLHITIPLRKNDVGTEN